MLKIEWADKITSEEVFDRIKEQTILWKNVRKRRNQNIVLVKIRGIT